MIKIKEYYEKIMEQRDHVETESGNHKECECTYQRHDDRDRWDDRRAQALQEDINHQNHQQDGFEQGLYHVLDGCVKEVLGTHQIDDFQTLRQVCPDLLDCLVHFHDDFIGI